MKKVYDYSVIFFQEDGSIEYETEKYGYALLFDESFDEPSGNATTFLEEYYGYPIQKANIVIKDDKCVKCRFHLVNAFLFYDKNGDHYNFYFKSR